MNANEEQRYEELRREYEALCGENARLEARHAATSEFVGEVEQAFRSALARGARYNDLLGVAQGLKETPNMFEELEAKLEARAGDLLKQTPQYGHSAADAENGDSSRHVDPGRLDKDCEDLRERNEHLRKELQASMEVFKDMNVTLRDSLRHSGRFDVMRLTKYCMGLVPVLAKLKEGRSLPGSRND